MVDFAGWEMPVQYSGIIDEHTAVRTRAGLFDVSHMGEVELRGDGALAACQYVTANDVRRLADGQAQYSLLLTPEGGIVDDIIVYRRAADRIFICVNASNRERDVAHLRQHVRGAEVVDRSDDYALLALQGPRATAILQRLTSAALSSAPRFAFTLGEVAGCPALIAHTGYTGEEGWELYCTPDAAPARGRRFSKRPTEGVVPAGLGARDTLRLEAALPLYGHELVRTRRRSRRGSHGSCTWRRTISSDARLAGASSARTAAFARRDRADRTWHSARGIPHPTRRAIDRRRDQRHQVTHAWQGHCPRLCGPCRERDRNCPRG
jgi:glycine cleavage system T protein